jgi:transcriptional regulator with XRE-family HTH domain
MSKHERRDAVSKLRRWISPVAGKTQEVLAERIGVGQSSVSRWLNRQSRPGLRAALALQRELGIPVESWDEI